MKIGLENSTERTKPATYSKPRPPRLGHRCVASAALLLAFIVLLAGTAQAQTVTRIDRLRPNGNTSTSTKAGGEFRVRIAFSPSATGLESDELEITNGTVSSFEQGVLGLLNIWLVDIAVDQSASTVKVKVPAGVTDAGDNPAAEVTYTVVPALTGTLTTTATEPAISGFRVTLTFSEGVEQPHGEVEANTWRFDAQSDVRVTGPSYNWHERISASEYRYHWNRSSLNSVGTIIFSLPRSVVATDRDSDIWNSASSIEIKIGKRSVSFDQATYSVDEGDAVEVKVVLNADPLNTVEIPLVATPQGGADASDFSGVPDFVTFNAGETEKSFTFSAVDEGIAGEGESVKITFGTTLPATIKRGSRTETTVTIVDAADTTVPVLSTATVNGTSLVLTYDETLDTGSVPAESAYSVEVDGGSGTAPANVSISGSAVTLTLATAVTAGQTVTVSYTPGTNPVQNLVGLDAGVLTNRAVANNTGNNTATGQPTISGTAQVGQTLTASTSGIADNNGLTTPGWTYQWILVDGGTETNITGATSSTYALGAATAGKQVKVKVSFTDDAGYSEELTSDAYPSSGTITSGDNIPTPDPPTESNSPATGQPTISGTAQMGQTLTASISGIADNNGLTTPGWTYQWILVDGGTETNITGATSSTYALGAATAGKQVKVKVSFTDDAGYSEELTSDAYPSSGTITSGGNSPVTDQPTESNSPATDPPKPRSVLQPRSVLRAHFRDVPAGHDGSTAFTLLIAFSERISTTAKQMSQALTVDGGTVSSVQQVDGRSNQWEITVTPNSDAAVRISLPPTTACSDAGAICSSNDSKVLERGIAVSIDRAPLTARFEEVPEGHHGTTPFTLHLAFSEPVETTAEALEQALTVTNGTGTSLQPVDDRRWEVTVTPNSNDAVRLSLLPTTACDDDNAVCTSGGWMLSEGVAVSVARAPLTAGFEEVPTEHIGIPFTLHLAFSEPVETTATTLEQVLTVTGGTINSLQPVDDRRDRWELQIQPNAADVSISLSQTTSCDDEGAICTQDDEALQNDAQADIPFSGYLMPHTLDKTSGEDQTGPASTQLAESFVVFAADEDGAAMAGVIVTFTVSAGGGMLSANTDADPCTFESAKSSITAITDANGQVSTRLTLGSEPGTNTVDISVAGLEPEPFTATATEQAMPNTLTKVCGEDQEGTAGELLAKPLVVFVSDEDGAAMAGVAVAFAVTAGGGRLLATTNTTNDDGYARTWLTLGSEPGTNTVDATVEGLESVTFTATGQASLLASFSDAFHGSGKRMALPDSPQLAQNAPNPFNSQTVLAYFLPAAEPVRLEVLSLTGQRVAVLRHGLQQAGYHQLHWDGRDDAGRSVASGLYLYRLVTDEVVLTRKLTLLR